MLTTIGAAVAVAGLILKQFHHSGNLIGTVGKAVCAVAVTKYGEHSLAGLLVIYAGKGINDWVQDYVASKKL